MKKLSIVLISLVICFLIAASTVRSASPSPNFQFRGIAPEDEKYYKSSEFIKCKDGSKKFGKAQLNDNFCDCVDGTDEPGTSACPNGRFYCRNRGHVPQVLFSSRVNDGICDCCDGSDEYDNRVTCPNTCWEAGKVARDKLKKKIATYKEGVTIRKQEVERAKVSIAKDEAELLKLQSEEKTLKGLVQQLKERKEQIEKEEEKEHLRKEKEEKEKREAEEKRKAEVEAKQENGEVVVKADGEVKAIESKDDDKIGSLEDSPSDPDNTEVHDALAAEHIPSDTTMNEQPSIHNVEAHPAKEIEESEAAPDVGSKASPDEFVNAGNDISENTEGLSKEELGRLVASRWTGQKTGKKTENVAEKDNNVEDNEGTEEMPDDTHDHDDDGYASETDDEHHRYDADLIEDEVEEEFKEDPLDSSSSESSESSESDTESDSSEETFPSITSWLEKIQQKVRNILQAINLFQTQVTPSDAARIRKEYDESSAKLSKIQGRISSLTHKLKLDFGLDKEFYPFYDQCFESKQNKYVYKVCPFKKASQVEGHSTTSLGRWDKFEDSYRVMVFSNGDMCWNGPDRSLKVKLRCGLKNEVADVDEPSRCEYVALLSTPAVCLEEKLKELQHKLDLMNKEQPQSHEEL